MQDRPDAGDLLEAVQEFLMKDVLPRLKENDLLAYKTLVSWNMLGVLARESRSGDELLNKELGRLASLLGKSQAKWPATYPEKLGLAREWNRELAARIRAEKIGPEHREIFGHLKESLSEALAISNPRFSQE